MQHAVRPNFCWNADILQLLCHPQGQRTLRAQSDHPIVRAPLISHGLAAGRISRPGHQPSELACPFTPTTAPERLIGMHWTGRLSAAAHHEIALLGIIDPVARLCCLSVSPTPGQVGASQEGPSLAQSRMLAGSCPAQHSALCKRHAKQSSRWNVQPIHSMRAWGQEGHEQHFPKPCSCAGRRPWLSSFQGIAVHAYAQALVVSSSRGST